MDAAYNTESTHAYTHMPHSASQCLTVPTIFIIHKLAIECSSCCLPVQPSLLLPSLLLSPDMGLLSHHQRHTRQYKHRHHHHTSHHDYKVPCNAPNLLHAHFKRRNHHPSKPHANNPCHPRRHRAMYSNAVHTPSIVNNASYCNPWNVSSEWKSVK